MFGRIGKFFFAFLALSSTLMGVDSAYVVNQTSRDISVINVANDTVTNTISPLGTAPADFSAITPDGQKIYVPNNTSNNVSIIDTTTQAVLYTRAVGNRPVCAAMLPNGTKVYIVNNNGAGAGSVSVINTTTDTVVATVSVGNDATYAAASPDSARVYVFNSNNSISVIDTATDTVTTLPNAGPTAQDSLVFTPDGSKVFAVGTESILVIDNAASPPTSLATIPLGGGSGPSGLAMSPDGVWLYVADIVSEAVHVIRVSTNTLAATIATPGNAQLRVTTSRDGARAYAFSPSAGTVTVINGSTNPPSFLQTVTVGNDPFSGGVTQDNSKLYVVNATNGINVIRVSDNAILGSITAGDTPVGLLFSPSGLPPTGLEGIKTSSQFLTQTDLINKITWSAPTVGTAPVSYSIYRNAALTDFVVSVPASAAPEYLDHNRRKGQTDTYYIVSVNANGVRSNAAVISITR